MATVAQDRAGTTPQQFVFRGVSWGRYLALVDWIGDGRVRVTYDRGRLEIMSPSPRHEVLGYLLGRVVDIISDEWDVPTDAFGSSTFRREDLDRGLEPDECYYLANAHRVRGKAAIDLDVDPPPDLAIEVDITSSSLDRMAIYAALGVPELWRFDDEALKFYGLDESRRYVERPESLNFPGLKASDVERFLLQAESMDKTLFRRAFRAWVRENLPRAPADGE